MSMFAELADGRRLEFPDGTDPAVIQRTVKKMLQPVSPAVPRDAPIRPMEPPTMTEKLLAKLPDIQGSIPGRYIQGAADFPVGALQLGMNAVGLGDPINKRVAEIHRDTEAFRGEDKGSFDPARFAGNVTTALIGGAPAAAPTLLGRMGQAGRMGAGYGAATPITNGGENFAADKVEQTGLSAFIGGLIPGGAQVAKSAGKGAYSVVEPFLPSGPGDILKRYQEKLLGPAKDKIVQAMMDAKELVAGSKPTAGEAAASIPEASAIAAHQKAIAKTPEVSGKYQAREGEQEAARRAAIQTVGRSKAELEAAETARAVEAAKNYGAAYSKDIKADPKLAAIAENPFFKDALPDALKLAEAKGIDSKADLTQVMHLVKISLDKQLAKSGDSALSNTEKQTVQGVKKRLVEWLGEKNPAYETARDEFAKASKPINQMQIGQTLESKLVAPLENTERAAMFAQAARDAPGTIKRSTGQPMFDKLSQVLTPEQEGVVNAITGDLSRKAQYEGLAKGTNLTGGTSISELNGVKAPNMLSRPAMVANFILKKFGAGADEKINKLAGEQYLNPKLLAQALKDVPKSERALFIEAILSRARPGAIAAPATAAAENY